MAHTLATHAALGQTLQPIIQDICPILKKVCDAGEALCGVEQSRAFKQHAMEHAQTVQELQNQNTFLLALALMMLMFLALVLCLQPSSTSKDKSENLDDLEDKKRRKWNKVVRDMQARSSHTSNGFAKDFFKNGDVKHGTLVVRYLQTCKFCIPVNAVDLRNTLVTIKQEAEKSLPCKLCENELPSPREAWQYALGCLRGCYRVNVSDDKLHRLLSKMVAGPETLQSLWDDVLKDTRERLGSDTYFGREYYYHGSTYHALLLLRYLKACGFRIPSKDICVIVPYKLQITKVPGTLKDADFSQTPPDPALAWTYAMGCLRDVTCCSAVSELFELVLAMTDHRDDK
jgi:hypothetical protein